MYSGGVNLGSFRAPGGTLKKDKSEVRRLDPLRFAGDGVTFKGKLIGVLEVSEARGEQMCQDAMGELKMAIKAAGEHKRRIIICIGLDGIRLRDESSKDCLYHHPVHRISFLAQDATDTRAFGYVFGAPDLGHRFFGIKTEKAAHQVVQTIRDLFEVVFSMRKKELTKSKSIKSEDSNSSKVSSPTKSLPGGNHEPDLLGSLQMEPKAKTPLGQDPFGDSFKPSNNSTSIASATAKPKNLAPFNFNAALPPPPPSVRQKPQNDGGCEKTWKLSASDPFASPPQPGSKPSENSQADRYASIRDLFHQDGPSIFDVTSQESSKKMTNGNESGHESVPDVDHQQNGAAAIEPEDLFTDLDPLQTGKSKPYMDKKDFFYDLKPTKKVLRDLTESGKGADRKEDPFGTGKFSENHVKTKIPDVLALYNQQHQEASSQETLSSDGFADFSVFQDNEKREDEVPKVPPLPTSRDRQEPPALPMPRPSPGRSRKAQDQSKDLSLIFSPPEATKSEDCIVQPASKWAAFSPMTPQPPPPPRSDSMSCNSYPLCTQVSFGSSVTGDLNDGFSYMEDPFEVSVSDEPFKGCDPFPPPLPKLYEAKPPPLPPKRIPPPTTKPPPRPPHDIPDSVKLSDAFASKVAKDDDTSPPIPIPFRRPRQNSNPHLKFSIQSEAVLAPRESSFNRIPPEKPDLKEKSLSHLDDVASGSTSSQEVSKSHLEAKGGSDYDRVADDASVKSGTSHSDAELSVTPSLSSSDTNLNQGSLPTGLFGCGKLNLPAEQINSMSLKDLASTLSASNLFSSSEKSKEEYHTAENNVAAKRKSRSCESLEPSDVDDTLQNVSSRDDTWRDAQDETLRDTTSPDEFSFSQQLGSPDLVPDLPPDQKSPEVRSPSQRETTESSESHFYSLRSDTENEKASGKPHISDAASRKIKKEDEKVPKSSLIDPEKQKEESQETTKDARKASKSQDAAEKLADEEVEPLSTYDSEAELSKYQGEDNKEMPQENETKQRRKDWHETRQSRSVSTDDLSESVGDHQQKVKPEQYNIYENYPRGFESPQSPLSPCTRRARHYPYRDGLYERYNRYPPVRCPEVEEYDRRYYRMPSRAPPPPRYMYPDEEYWYYHDYEAVGAPCPPPDVYMGGKWRQHWDVEPDPRMMKPRPRPYPEDDCDRFPPQEVRPPPLRHFRPPPDYDPYFYSTEEFDHDPWYPDDRQSPRSKRPERTFSNRSHYSDEGPYRSPMMRPRERFHSGDMEGYSSLHRYGHRLPMARDARDGGPWSPPTRRGMRECPKGETPPPSVRDRQKFSSPFDDDFASSDLSLSEADFHASASNEPFSVEGASGGDPPCDRALKKSQSESQVSGGDPFLPSSNQPQEKSEPPGLGFEDTFRPPDLDESWKADFDSEEAASSKSHPSVQENKSVNIFKAEDDPFADDFFTSVDDDDLKEAKLKSFDVSSEWQKPFEAFDFENTKFTQP